MGAINNFLGKILGNKSERDIGELTPFLERISEAYAEITVLSNDNLRKRTPILKQKIKDDLFEHIDGLYNHFPKINDFNKISLRKK